MSHASNMCAGSRVARVKCALSSSRSNEQAQNVEMSQLQIAVEKPFSQRSETILYIKKRTFRTCFFMPAGTFEKEEKYKTILQFWTSDQVDANNQRSFPPEKNSFLNTIKTTEIFVFLL